MRRQKIETADRVLAGKVRKNSAGWMLKSLSAGLDKTMLQALQPLNLTLGQFAILMTLLEGDGITQSEIGKRISMPGYATTRNIDVLEENGLLERQKNKSSRRSFCIRLTDNGRALAPTLFSIVRSVNERLLSSLDAIERKQLINVLQKLLNSQNPT